MLLVSFFTYICTLCGFALALVTDASNVTDGPGRVPAAVGDAVDAVEILALAGRGEEQDGNQDAVEHDLLREKFIILYIVLLTSKERSCMRRAVLLDGGPLSGHFGSKVSNLPPKFVSHFFLF